MQWGARNALKAGRAALLLSLGAAGVLLPSSSWAQAPASEPALTLTLALALQDTPHNTQDSPPPATAAQPSSTTTDTTTGTGSNSDTSAQRPNFNLEIDTDHAAVKTLLEQHLALHRYRLLPGLRRAELTRLMSAADADIRKLLGNMGYFAPTLELVLQDVPRDSEETPLVRIHVQPGEQAVVMALDIQVRSPQGNVSSASSPDSTAPAAFAASATPGSEPGQADPPGNWQRQAVVRNWRLPAGQPFSQEAWAAAKKEGLSRLQERRYPTARLSESRADVDADTLQVRLQAHYDSGPLYYFGPLRVEGAQRYDSAGIARIARIPVGAQYQQRYLLEAQQRLAASGFYDSVFLTLDTAAADPDAPEAQVAVLAQVREATLQKWEYGLGVSTDTGPRLSIEHRHNRLPGLGWQAHSKIQLDQSNPLLSSRLQSLPDEGGWHWFVAAQAQRAELADYTVNSLALSGGRSKSAERIDRQYFVRYDMASPRDKDKERGAPPSSSSISANYGWTGRYFNNASSPTRGHGLALEAGIGWTLTPQRTPFVRTAGRWLYIHPLSQRDSVTKRRSRLAVRTHLGSLLARSDAVMPLTLLFLSGGDTTVRGYSYQSIGTRSPWGLQMGGRYTLASSVEWQRPMVLAGNTKDWEHTLFVDAGSVSDRLRADKIYIGAGAGIRWNSPVGPLQADLAYGLQSHKMRLHLRLGFNF
ncbi:MAG: BamA/TamA family outer membrane protein [Comamonas sp.]|nr:BamA/TamA family outer membrane protein [Comamonas sp.]